MFVQCTWPYVLLLDHHHVPMVQKSLHFKTFIGESRIFFFHYHFAWDDWWYHVFLRACCFERKWWYFVCKLFFFLHAEYEKEKRFVHVCPLGWCPILFFFEYREYNDVTFKVRTIKMFFFCGNSLFTTRSHSHGN